MVEHNIKKFVLNYRQTIPDAGDLRKIHSAHCTLDRKVEQRFWVHGGAGRRIYPYILLWGIVALYKSVPYPVKCMECTTQEYYSPSKI